MTILKYGSYTFPLTPVITIRHERIGEAEGAAQGVRETWDMAGMLTGATQAALKTASDALELAFVADGSDLTLFKDDAITVLHQLASASCAHGTQVLTRPEFPKGEGAEYATVRTFHVAVSGYTLLGDAATRNAHGGYTTETSTDAGGTVHVTVAGQYIGETLADAQAAAAAAKAAGYMAEREAETENEDTCQVSFRYEYLDDTSSREVISFRETTVAHNIATPDFVIIPILGGGAPVTQETVRRANWARQSGSATGRTGYPSAPGGLFGTPYLKSSQTSKESPRRTKDEQLTDYTIHWDYTYERATPFGLPAPGTPPV